MKAPRSAAPRTRRQRRQRVAWITTVVGLLALSTVGVVVQRARDTDFAELDGAVTTNFAGGIRPAGAPDLRFEEVTAEVGLGGVATAVRQRLLTEDTAGGLAWGDADRDGWPDLFVAGTPGAADGTGSRIGRLWRNVNGHFEDVTFAAGIVASDCIGMGASWVDENDDGRLDLFVTCVGPNRLFRNLGEWHFEDVAAAVGLANSAWSTGAAWADYDRDGDLDLYLGNYVDQSSLATEPSTPTAAQTGWEGMPFSLNPNAFDPAANALYRRQPDGTYEEVALPSGVLDPAGRTLAVAWIDLDGDGWLDLAVNNDVSPNAVFRSLGDLGTGEVLFEDVSATVGAADPRGSMGLCIADLGAGRFPQDGRPDLFITHWLAQENALYQTVAVATGFEVRDRTRVLGLGEISLELVGWGCASADFDLDGRLDLVVANGSTLEQRSDPSQLRPEPMLLFWNDGETFADLAPWSGPALVVERHARGLALADYDRDGDLDIAIAQSNAGPVLLRNNSAVDGTALVVALSGRPWQIQGARIEVEAGGLRQVRWVGADVSFLSGHQAIQIFGILGRAADHVDVRWADGTTTKLSGPLAGRVIVAPP